MMRRLLIIVIGLATLAIAAPADNSNGFIFVPGSAGFPEAHASTLVELKNGAMMAAWFGGTKEGADDVAIWGAVRRDGRWSRQQVLVREPHIPCWNPVLFHSATGRLWLYYKFGPKPSEWTAGRLYSDDEGVSWSAPEHLPAGLLGPIRAKPLLLGDGTILAGSSVESYQSWAVWIERSADNGATWQKIGPITLPAASDIPDAGARAAAAEKGPIAHNVDSGIHTKLYPPTETTIGIIQPTLIDLGNHHIRLYARAHTRSARIVAADSFDDGRHWTQGHDIDLPNPNSGIDAVRLRDGRIVMIYNNSYNRRNVLNLAVSRDGEHFRMFRTPEDGEGQFSYPAMIQARDGSLRMTYTYQRRTIKYLELPLSAVPE
ncbi:MAG: exo-alpha-sialidase [Alphaproteobacteria bacterium]|nr:exo-alpha-sialidase [Alphaproteobacteria bacterium]